MNTGKLVEKFPKLLSDKFPEKLSLALFSLLSVIMLWKHEPWADEAQAWLLAKNTGWFEMFSYGGYEGSPMLWHIILKFLSYLGFPMISMRIVHTMCAIAAAYLVLFNAPFERYQRIMAIFGYYFVFEYNVVARSYVLSILFLSYIGSIYDQRYKRPVIYGLTVALLAQTNLHSLIFALALVGVNFVEHVVQYNKKMDLWKNVVPIYILFSGSFLLAIVTMFPPHDIPTFLADWDSIRAGNPLGYAFFFLMRGFFPMQTLGTNFWSYDLRVAFFGYTESIMMGILLLLLVIYLTYDKFYPLLLVLPIFVGYSIIFVYKRGICPRHCGFMYVAFFFAYWLSFSYPAIISISEFSKGISPELGQKLPIQLPKLSGVDTRKIRSLIFTTILLIQLVSAPIPIYHDYQDDFSNAEKTAAYLINNNYISNDSVLAAHSWFPTLAIIPHLPEEHQQLYFVQQEQYGTFVKWNEEFFDSQIIGLNEIVNRSLEYAAETDPENFVLILDFPVNLDNQFYTHFSILQYFEDALIVDENFYLYIMV